MEKLCEMLNRRQLMLVIKEFSGSMPVSGDIILELVSQISNRKYYREKGTTNRWQFDYQNGAVVGVHRRLNYFA